MAKLIQQWESQLFSFYGQILSWQRYIISTNWHHLQQLSRRTTCFWAGKCQILIHLWWQVSFSDFNINIHKKDRQMWLRISSLTGSLSLPVQKHPWESHFRLVFSHVETRKESSLPGTSILQHKMRTVVTLWTWTLDDVNLYWLSRLYLAIPWFVLPTMTNCTRWEHLPAHEAHGHVSAGSVPTLKSSHRESLLCWERSLWITRWI